jgi:hypothetical protein
MFIIFLKITLILALVRPLENPISILYILNPVSNILTSINPLVMAEAMDLVVNPIAAVLRSISPTIETKTIFYTLVVIAFIAASIWPHFIPLSVLLVSEPRALVNSTALMLELSVSMGFSEDPISVINFTSDVRKDAPAVCLT